MNTDQTYRYRMAELIRACPFPVPEQTTLMIQLRSEHGSTKWLNVTPSEFRLIERVLEGIITDET